MKSLRSLSNNDSLNQLNELVKKEHVLSLEILPHLLEVEDRGLHLGAGYPSLFKYCVDSLGFSESTAGRRSARILTATVAVRNHPLCPRHPGKRSITIILPRAKS